MSIEMTYFYVWRKCKDLNRTELTNPAVFREPKPRTVVNFSFCTRAFIFFSFWQPEPSIFWNSDYIVFSRDNNGWSVYRLRNDIWISRRSRDRNLSERNFRIRSMCVIRLWIKLIVYISTVSKNFGSSNYVPPNELKSKKKWS